MCFLGSSQLSLCGDGACLCSDKCVRRCLLVRMRVEVSSRGQVFCSAVSHLFLRQKVSLIWKLIDLTRLAGQ